MSVVRGVVISPLAAAVHGVVVSVQGGEPATFNAVTFNGTDQYGTMPAFMPASGVFEYTKTLILVDRAADYVLLDSAGGLVRLEVSTAGYLRWRFNNSGALTYATSTAQVPVGAEVTLFARYDRNNSTATLGVNGVTNQVTGIAFPSAFAGFTVFGKNYTNSTGILKSAGVKSISMVDPYAIQPDGAAASFTTVAGNGTDIYGQMAAPLTLPAQFEIEWYAKVPEAGTYFFAYKTSSQTQNRFGITKSNKIIGLGFPFDVIPGHSFPGSGFYYKFNVVQDATTLKFYANDKLFVTASAGSGGTIDSIMSKYSTVSTDIPYHSGVMSKLKIWSGNKSSGTLLHSWDLRSGLGIQPDSVGGNNITWMNAVSATTVNKVDRTYLINEQSGNLLLDSAGGGSNITLINYLESQRVTI